MTPVCPAWAYIELRPGYWIAPFDLCRQEAYGLPEPGVLLGLIVGIVVLAILGGRR